MFVGRKEELRELGERFESNRFETALISGKRRIGKSQLIVEALRGFDGMEISYECFDSTYVSNLRNIEAAIKKKLRQDYLHFDSLYEVILFLHECASKQKIVFSLDEYPYMREGDATDSEIKNAIDRINAMPKKNPLKIVLCGSAIDVMNLLDKQDKPLYGRFTSKISLKELNYLESSAFYPSASLEDKVNYYGILGGVPYYLEQIDGNKTFEENIVRLFFSSSALLKAELESFVNYEIAKLENAPFVMGIIGNKMLSHTDIKQAYNASYPKKSIDYVLTKLTDIEAIEKVSVKQSNGKERCYYRIQSASLRFYYTFLGRSFGNRLLFTAEDYYKEFVEEGLLNSFLPHAFERVGMEFVALMNRNGFLPDLLLDLYPYTINDKVAKRNFEFDVVGETKNGLIDYECKCRKEPIHPLEVDLEARQAQLAGEHFVKTVFISKSEVISDKAESYGLKDLFSERLLALLN